MKVAKPHLNPTRWTRSARYMPLDELLEMPRVRILRTLQRFDWATCEDVRLALGIDADERDANTFSTMITRLAREGYLERDNAQFPPRYRINECGREHLRDLLARAGAEVREGAVAP